MSAAGKLFVPPPVETTEAPVAEAPVTQVPVAEAPMVEGDEDDAEGNSLIRMILMSLWVKRANADSGSEGLRPRCYHDATDSEGQGDGQTEGQGQSAVPSGDTTRSPSAQKA